VVKRLRGGDEKKEIEYKGITLHVLDREIRVPTQMFINGKFVDAKSGKTDGTINPTTEEEIAQVSHYSHPTQVLTHTFLRLRRVMQRMSMKQSRPPRRPSTMDPGAR